MAGDDLSSRGGTGDDSSVAVSDVDDDGDSSVASGALPAHGRSTTWLPAGASARGSVAGSSVGSGAPDDSEGAAAVVHLAVPAAASVSLDE